MQLVPPTTYIHTHTGGILSWRSSGRTGGRVHLRPSLCHNVDNILFLLFHNADIAIFPSLITQPFSCNLHAPKQG
jgi:hypothetical protein